jgi:hypothetical protein
MSGHTVHTADFSVIIVVPTESGAEAKGISTIVCLFVCFVILSGQGYEAARRSPLPHERWLLLLVRLAKLTEHGDGWSLK